MSDKQTGNTPETCKVCGRPVRVQIRKGSRICSNACEDIHEFSRRKLGEK